MCQGRAKRQQGVFENLVVTSCSVTHTEILTYVFLTFPLALPSRQDKAQEAGSLHIALLLFLPILCTTWSLCFYVCFLQTPCHSVQAPASRRLDKWPYPILPCCPEIHHPCDRLSHLGSPKSLREGLMCLLGECCQETLAAGWEGQSGEGRQPVKGLSSGLHCGHLGLDPTGGLGEPVKTRQGSELPHLRSGGSWCLSARSHQPEAAPKSGLGRVVNSLAPLTCSAGRRSLSPWSERVLSERNPGAGSWNCPLHAKM